MSSISSSWTVLPPTGWRRNPRAVLFCRSIVRFLDIIEYDDYNLAHDERISALREVHSKTAEYFAQPLARETLKDAHRARIATVCRTISHLVVYCWLYVPREVQVDVTIWQSIINVLDDEVSADPAASTSTLLTDMLAGRLMQLHLPKLLAHFGSFCGFKSCARPSTISRAAGSAAQLPGLAWCRLLAHVRASVDYTWRRSGRKPFASVGRIRRPGIVRGDVHCHGAHRWDRGTPE